MVSLALRRRLAALDEQAAGRGLLVLSGVATVLAIFQLVRLTVFTVAPTRDDFAAVPWSSFSRHHYCGTAYFVAGGVAREVTNVYDNALYDHPDSVATAQRKPRTIDGFNVDVYEYPPPFLLLPRIVDATGAGSHPVSDGVVRAELGLAAPGDADRGLRALTGTGHPGGAAHATRLGGYDHHRADCRWATSR